MNGIQVVFWLILCPLGIIWLLTRLYKDNRETGSSVVKATGQTAKQGITGAAYAIGIGAFALVVIALMVWIQG